jgi:hypothetical protein
MNPLSPQLSDVHSRKTPTPTSPNQHPSCHNYVMLQNRVLCRQLNAQFLHRIDGRQSIIYDQSETYRNVPPT